MRRARVNGIELEYDVSGSGEPLLMISPVIADGFRPLVAEPALAGRFQIVTYHRRGSMGSTRTAPPVSVGDHAADAAALLEWLGLRRVHIAGHSSAAAVAVQLVLDRPELVQSVALFELSLLTVPAAEGFIQKASPAFDAYGAGRREEAVAIFMSALSGLEWERCRALLEERIPGAVEQVIHDADTFFGIELPGLSTWKFGAEEAAMITQPVLSVLGGATQPLWVAIGDVLRSWIPAVEECTIPGVGHLLHIQDPQPVAEHLAAFVRRHPIAGPEAGRKRQLVSLPS